MNDEPEQDRPQVDDSEEVQPEGPPPSAQAEEVPFEEQAAAPAKKPRSRVWRIACLVFVVIAAVLIVLEFRARQGYTRTVEEFDQAWQAAQQEGKGVYREDLDKLIHGGPSRELDQKRGMETFTWRGLRTYRLEVQYGDVGFVTSFQAFQPEQ
jgi:hypothetical protein